MLKKHVTFLSADSEAWQAAFEILMFSSSEFPQCKQATAEIYQMFQDWNEQHMGTLTLTELNQQYIQSVLGG